VTAAFIVVVVLALMPQIAFSVLYWRWIPGWTKNSYGRLAQLGSWCHIILLTLYLVLVLFGKSFNPIVAGVILISAFVPLVLFGVLQLILLKRAVDSAKEKK
jgi:hypothetical protein